MHTEIEIEVEVYLTQHWYTDHAGRPSSPIIELDDYNGMTLSEAEADLRSRGYVCKDAGGRGKLNVLTIWAHPTSGIHWGLSAR